MKRILFIGLWILVSLGAISQAYTPIAVPFTTLDTVNGPAEKVWYFKIARTYPTMTMQMDLHKTSGATLVGSIQISYSLISPNVGSKFNQLSLFTLQNVTDTVYQIHSSNTIGYYYRVYLVVTSATKVVPKIYYYLRPYEFQPR